MALSQSFPILDDDIDLCLQLDQDHSRGLSLEEALISFIQNFQSTDSELLDAIRRTILRKVIVDCQYPPEIVLRAGYAAGLPVEMMVQETYAAGVRDFVISATLFNLDVDPDLVASAVDGMKSPLISDSILPPPFEIQSGLGQASPFTP